MRIWQEKDRGEVCRFPADNQWGHFLQSLSAGRRGHERGGAKGGKEEDQKSGTRPKLHDKGISPLDSTPSLIAGTPELKTPGHE